MKKTRKIIISISALIVAVAVALGSVWFFANRPIEDLGEAKVGDIISFGEYERDGNNKNGDEEIEWIVLDKKDGKILVISRYAIEKMPYNGKSEYVLWENCDLREWLNSNFYEDAFSSSEKKAICDSILTHNNTDVKLFGGNSTTDKVFVLSFAEAEEYMDILSENRMKVPKYVKKQYDGNTWKYGWSWLRSPGSNNKSATYMGDGRVGTVFAASNGKGVGDKLVMVRPAMWISVK